MRNSEIDSLNNAYQTFVRLVISEGPVDQLGEVATADVMGYGTTIDEIIHDLPGLKNVARLQREQTPNENFHYNASPVFRKMINQDRSGIFVDEIQLNFVFDGKPLSFQIRLSTVMELFDGVWKVVHFHASKPEYDSGGNDPWHKEEWQKKNEELQMLVDQKTADLEQKNSELEVEAALERVRTVAMSMQKPDDLLEVCQIISDQLELLNVSNIRNTQVAIVDEPKRNYLNYQYFTPYSKKVFELTDYENHPTSQAMVSEMQKSANSFFEGSMQGEQLQSFSEWRKKYDQFPDPLLDKTPAVYYYFYSIGKGGLGLTTYQAISESELNIFKRFHKVFELAYSRFHDIQKAEAQAREAQIEAVLERIRSKSLAMYKTDDLGDVVSVLFEQMQLLSVDMGFASVSIFIFEEGSRDIYQWIQLPDRVASLRVPYFEHPISSNLFDAKDAGADYFSKIYTVDEKNSWLEKGLELTDYKNLPEEFKTSLLEAPGYAISITLAKNSGICIPSFVGSLPSAEDVEIMKRVGKVFEQTYTRFLDLQKAEAQARESQIELSLERIRAQVTAMQESSDLLDIVVTMRTEFVSLGHEAHYFWYMRWHPEAYEKAMTSGDGTKIGMIMSLPRHIHGDIKLVADWEKSDEPALVFAMDVETAVDYIQKMITLGDFVQVDPNAPTLDDIRHIGGLTFIMARTKHGEIGFSLPGAVPNPPQESLDTLVRFAAVFDLAYRRFEDLKDAERRNREMQIELGLERSRTQSMLMQHSDELGKTTQVFHEQLQLLGIDSEFSYLWLPDEANHEHLFWATWDEISNGTTIFKNKTVSYPLDKKEPSIAACYLAWGSGQRVHINPVAPDEVENYFATWEELLHGVDKFRPELFPKGIYYLDAYMKYGCFGIMIKRPISEDEKIILSRFTIEFERAYTRFLDLLKAEEQAVKSEEDLIKLKVEKQRAENALSELKVTQTQLIHAEKMASLGELTAGIAHEIQNPLNFVNNFSEVSVDLIDELNEEIETGNTEEVKAISGDLKSNLQKIHHHGQRASFIVQGMLEHSRTNPGDKKLTDINVLADEFLKLSYHGLRAKDKSFNAELKMDFDKDLPLVNVVPQDIGRVLLNLFNNAFYAVSDGAEKIHEFSPPTPSPPTEFSPPAPPMHPAPAVQAGKDAMHRVSTYKPLVTLTTKTLGNKIEIRVQDNGNGIPDKIKDKIFQPFFTTKPTGQGTGLGLSMSYDIITKGHGGELKVETEENKGTTFSIIIPINN